MNSTGPRPEGLPRRSRWALVLLLYPFILYGLLTSGYMLAEWLGLVSLGLLILLPSLLEHRVLAWASLALIAMVAGYAAASGHRALVNTLPQILICTFLMVVFARTLRPGRMPLISRISHAMRKGQSEVPMRYTRGLTVAWVVIFALLVLEGLLLAYLGPEISFGRISAATYSVVVVALVAEYWFHTWRFPNPAQRGVVDFLRGLVQIDYRRLMSD